MTDIVYTNPRAVETLPSPTPTFRYDNPRPSLAPTGVDTTTGDKVKTALTAAGYTAAAGLTGFGVAKALRKFFPGMTPTRSLIHGLNEAMTKDNSEYGLKQAVPEWMAHVDKTGKPVTFADFLSSKGMGTSPNTQQFLNTVLNNSGKGQPIRNNLITRMQGTPDRVNADLARSLGVTPQSLKEVDDSMKEARSLNAKPLYDEAFKDNGALKDTRSLDLYDKHGNAILDAMNSVRKYSNQDFDTAVARDADHRLFWKNPVTIEDVPEDFRSGEYKAKMQKYFQPSTQDWHRIRESLWNKFSTYKASDNPDKRNAAGQYLDAWKDVTKFMDDAAPDAYKAARQQYKTDSDILNAKDVGTNLLDMDPRDARAAITTMSPEERSALGRGFMSSMGDTDRQKLVRQFVAKPGDFPNQNANLQLVFDDPRKLNGFLSNLEGEQSLLAGSKSNMGAAPADDPSLTNLSVRVGNYIGAHPFAAIRDTAGLKAPKVASNAGVARRGADLLFNDPLANPSPGSRLYDVFDRHQRTGGPWPMSNAFDIHPLEQNLAGISAAAAGPLSLHEMNGGDQE